MSARFREPGRLANRACIRYPPGELAVREVISGGITVRTIMGETLLNVAVAAGILGGSFVLTNLFVRKMYYRCRKCGALNAKRRSQCRMCAESLP